MISSEYIVTNINAYTPDFPALVKLAHTVIV